MAQRLLVKRQLQLELLESTSDRVRIAVRAEVVGNLHRVSPRGSRAAPKYCSSFAKRKRAGSNCPCTFGPNRYSYKLFRASAARRRPGKLAVPRENKWS